MLSWVKYVCFAFRHLRVVSSFLCYGPTIWASIAPLPLDCFLLWHHCHSFIVVLGSTWAPLPTTSIVWKTALFFYFYLHLVAFSRPSPLSFPSFRPGTASFTLLPFDATWKPLPRWSLALAKEAVRWFLFLRHHLGFLVALSHLCPMFLLRGYHTALISRRCA